MNIRELHEKALGIVRRLQSVEFELIEVLMQMDELRGYLELGYSSLYDYAINALKLSEASASNFITVARKSKIIPELKLAIQEGELSVAKARKITPVVTKENSSSWIEMAKTMPKAKLEQAVAKVAPQTLTPERTKYVNESRLELRFGVSEEIMQMLKRAQDIVSQNTKAPANYEETLKELLTEFLQRKDPLEKAKRNSRPKINASASVPDRRFENTQQKHRPVQNSRYIPAALKHNIYMRDNGQCRHMNNGKRCENRRWIDIHHIKPLSLGGMTTEQNLITLCSAHHKQQHALEEKPMQFQIVQSIK